MRRIKFAAAFASALAAAGVCMAYPYPFLYHEPASGEAGKNRAGAEGLYGTGGKQDHGIKCSHCHIDGDGSIGMNVLVTKMPAGSPTGWDDVGGADGYEPGATYRIRLELTGEHEIEYNPNMPAQRADLNGVAATVEDQGGKLAGELISDSGQNSSSNCPGTYPYTNGSGGYVHAGPGGTTTVLFGDCHAILSFHELARTNWTFDWKAPAAGAGEVTLFVGMVDGNQGGENSQDDDAVEKSFALLEGP